MAAPLEALPEPPREPIVLVIGGVTEVVPADHAGWEYALHARELEATAKRLEGELRIKRAQVEAARTDAREKAERERLSFAGREIVERVFEVWRTESGRTRCKLTPERFDLIVDRLGEDYDEAALTMAAIGIAANPFVIDGERRNDFETAFKSGGQVERYANRCPAERRRELSGRLFDEGEA